MSMKKRTIVLTNIFLWRTRMKSFSLKALALAAIVVVGSAQAVTMESCKAAIKNTLTKIDRTVFGRPAPIVGMFADNLPPIFEGGLSAIRPSNGYVRAGIVTIAGAAVVAGAVVAAKKAYNHFTKSAAETTEENTEANTNVEAAQ
jgi:hypothetical protein